jgi:hypothetical protein
MYRLMRTSLNWNVQSSKRASRVMRPGNAFAPPPSPGTTKAEPCIAIVVAQTDLHL